VTDNEFSVESCVEICSQIIQAKDQHSREMAVKQQPARIERAISLNDETPNSQSFAKPPVPNQSSEKQIVLNSSGGKQPKQAK
jgi:hypothetical protein